MHAFKNYIKAVLKLNNKAKNKILQLLVYIYKNKHFRILNNFQQYYFLKDKHNEFNIMN